MQQRRFRNKAQKGGVKQCSKEGCGNLSRRGGLCYSHWSKSIDLQNRQLRKLRSQYRRLLLSLQPSETACAICFDKYNVNEMVTCAAESACSCALCHDCLVTCFSKPWRMVNGQLIEYDPTQCPACRKVGAFSLDETDAAIVNMEMNERYCFETASVGASYASTSHEQSDSEWEMGDE